MNSGATTSSSPPTRNDPTTATRDVSALGYQRIVLLLVGLVIVPTGLLTLVGLLLLFLGDARMSLVMGILVLCFAGAVVTGSVLVWVFVRREANLSKLQIDFVSKVSHELRTPLTSIRMFTETLSMRGGDPEVDRRCVDALTKESLRLQTLIDRLLDWGRMESGRRLYLKEDTDVATVLEQAVQSFEPVRERRGVAFELVVPEGLPKLNVDRDALVDAIVNLLSNAYKYGGDPRAITLAAAADDGHVRISVRDNGAGIARTEHKRIFQKFYRVDDSLSREREGSGLGLAIVDHIVHAHGGRVEVESAKGKGSTFTIVLATPTQARPGAPRDATKPATRGGTTDGDA